MSKPTATATTAAGKVDRDAQLRWIPLDLIRVSSAGQRDLNPARVDRILSNLDLEQIGTPTVNQRGECFYVIDGQHRIAALRQFFADDPDVKIQCWTYFNLNEDDEAEKFLKLNDTLTVSAFAKFRVGVTAGRPDETDIDRIVRANGCVVTQDHLPGAISAVGTLRTIYGRMGGDILGHTIRVIRDAYGDPGFEAAVIHGIALVIDRYGTEVDDLRLVTRLGKANGGAKGLLQRGERYRLQTGNLRAHCVAAAAVDTYNAGRGGKKLPAWWKDAA